MKSDDYEACMRQFEWLGRVRVPPECYIVLRLDGKGFSQFTYKRFEKPFDARMSEMMVKAATVLMKEFGAIYAFTESDEMSLVLPPSFDLHDREVEKLTSISAGIVSSAFTFELCKAELAQGVDYVAFDSRVWCSENTQRVVDYFRWREADALRCGLNAWAYWTLRKSGKSEGQATSALNGKGSDFKNELLFERGMNFNDVPLWQKRGVGIYWETFQKPATNRLTGQPVLAERRRLKVDRELPAKDAYSELVRRIIA